MKFSTAFYLLSTAGAVDRKIEISNRAFKVNSSIRHRLGLESAPERTLQDCSGQGSTWGAGIGPPPDGCGNGAPGGDGAPAEGGQSSCDSPPCAAALLGDVGFVVVTGTDERTGKSFANGENIYGPFEAGFGSQQADILEVRKRTAPSFDCAATRFASFVIFD